MDTAFVFFSCDKHGIRTSAHRQATRRQLESTPDGTAWTVDDALRWKQRVSERTDARNGHRHAVRIRKRSQSLEWADTLKTRWNRPADPYRVSRGPAKPSNLASNLPIALHGVGPSLRVLQKARDGRSNCCCPTEPTECDHRMATHQRANPDFKHYHVHSSPLGGIKTKCKLGHRRMADPALRQPANSV